MSSWASNVVDQLRQDIAGKSYVLATPVAGNTCLATAQTDASRLERATTLLEQYDGLAVAEEQLNKVAFHPLQDA
jgi:hypothetical protein